MLMEPPGEALDRTSTFSLVSEQPGWIDLTTVYKQTWATPAEVYIWIDRMNGDASKSSESASVNITGRNLHTKAIYKIEGHHMTYCVAAPGQPRPTEFMTKKGDGCTLVSLQVEVVSSNPIWPQILSSKMGFPSLPLSGEGQ